MRFIKKNLSRKSLEKNNIYNTLYRCMKFLRYIRLPFSSYLGFFLFHFLNAWLMVWRRFKQFFFFEPMFRYRCSEVGEGLYFESTFPLILGYGKIIVGDRVRISGKTNFIVSYKVNENPTIKIGNDVYIGYQSILSCAEKISIGSNVLMAQNVTIYDNNNHPLSHIDRARNEPVEKAGVSPVIIEDYVWLAANVTILKGVTIGEGAIVATGAIVTKDVDPFTLVAGNPATFVKKLL